MMYMKSKLEGLVAESELKAKVMKVGNMDISEDKVW